MSLYPDENTPPEAVMGLYSFVDVENLAKENAALKEQVAQLTSELETERMRLAACGVAALGYFNGCKDEYRSASLDDTVSLYANQITEQAKGKVLTDAFEKARMLLCETNPNCSSEYLFGSISGAFKRLDEALATVKGE